ncbi:MAG: hypothetical protein N2712_03145 [Brevinematales bacterium]|nr:hypothetical protein [Brevinematales bacterium]
MKYVRLFGVLLFYGVTFNIWPVQFEFLSQGAKNIAVGRSGANLFKDPTSTIINPSSLSLENSYMLLYYEASSSVNVGNIMELYSKRFVFDPANIGVSLRINNLTRFSILYTSYIHDFDSPETIYKPLLFGVSGKIAPFILVGISVGPVLGINDVVPVFSFMAVGGAKFKFEESLSISFVIKSPFSTSYYNTFYGEITQTFPPILSIGGAFHIYNGIILSSVLEIVFLNFVSAKSGSAEIFLFRDKIHDYIFPKIGLVYYDNVSGYRIMAGFSKTQIEVISRSIPQYHLSAGVTFFIKIPNLNEFEVNFCLDDQILLNILRIFPENSRKISLHVSGEIRF